MSYDNPEVPGDRLCVETNNVYHRDSVVSVGRFYIQKDIYESAFYPPREEDYLPQEKGILTIPRIILLLMGLVLVGVGLGFLLPV